MYSIGFIGWLCLIVGINFLLFVLCFVVISLGVLYIKRPFKYSSIGLYKLENKKVTPVEDELEWIAWYSTTGSRFIESYSTVYKTLEVPGSRIYISVETVFLGIDNNFHTDGIPLLFETLIEGGPFDGEKTRSSSLEEALKVHKRCIERVQTINKAGHFLESSQAGRIQHTIDTN